MDLSIYHCGYEENRFVCMEAAEELAAEDTPIGDVGAAVGYPNQLNFSRAFKGVYGMLPREYRQRNIIRKVSV